MSSAALGIPFKPIEKDKSIKARGKKRPKETLYYFNNARVLADLAKKKTVEIDDKVVAVLFRDSELMLVRLIVFKKNY